MLHDTANAHGLKLVTFRYFNVAGVDRDMRTGPSTPDATHLIRRAVQTAIGLQPEMHVYGTDYDTADGTCVRDYVNIADVMRAHIDALGYLRTNGQPVTLNCGSGRGVSVLQVIDAVKRVSGADFRVVHAPRRTGDPASVVASPARARDCLGWRPHADDLDEIIRHQLAWEIERKARNGRSATPDQEMRVRQPANALAFEAPAEAPLVPRIGLGLKSGF
jgi:UDP-glucose 4-epimerase